LFASLALTQRQYEKAFMFTDLAGIVWDIRLNWGRDWADNDQNLQIFAWRSFPIVHAQIELKGNT
jgi:hypothetical protein